jgi:uncharacterized membrane protein YccF (DUF307 family)
MYVKYRGKNTPAQCIRVKDRSRGSRPYLSLDVYDLSSQVESTNLVKAKNMKTNSKLIETLENVFRLQRPGLDLLTFILFGFCVAFEKVLAASGEALLIHGVVVMIYHNLIILSLRCADVGQNLLH